jgi:predicted Zn-dependent peptidase
MFADAALRGDEFESERRVILEEIHMAADVPEDLVHDVFSATAWPNHPFGRPVLGTEKTVGGMSVDALRAFYERGYVAEKLVIAVAGNIDHGSVAALVRGAFGGGSSPARRIGGDAPVFGAGAFVVDSRSSEQVHLVWGVESLGREDPDRFALSVLSVLYGGGMSSRLFQEVREKRGLAYSIYSGEHMYLEAGSHTVYAGTQSSTAADVLKIVRDEASKLAAGDATEEEVERAKSNVRGGLVLSMDDPGGRMSRIGRSELVHGEVITVEDLLERVDAVTTDDVARVAKRLYATAPPALAVVGPVSSGSLDFAVDPLAD